MLACWEKMSNFTMGTISGMGFAQALVHTVHSTRNYVFPIPTFRSWLRFWSDKRVKFNNGIQNSVEKWSTLTEQVLASRNFSDAKKLVEFMQSKKGFLFWAMTPLQQAMRADLKNHEENMVMFEFCLRYGQSENIDEINGKGNTLLHEAIVLQSIKALGFRNFEKVRYIINVMANIDVENSEGSFKI